MQSPDILHIMRCATSPAYTSCPTLPVSPGSQYSLNLHKHLLTIRDLLVPMNGHNRSGIRDNLSQSVSTVSLPSFLFFHRIFLSLSRIPACATFAQVAPHQRGHRKNSYVGCRQCVPRAALQSMPQNQFRRNLVIKNMCAGDATASPL